VVFEGVFPGSDPAFNYKILDCTLSGEIDGLLCCEGEVLASDILAALGGTEPECQALESYGASCDGACETAADCPTYGLPCEDFFPGAPEQCCDGACEPNACWPGAQITLSFTKKVGCTAGLLSGIAEGDPFDVVISGGSLAECGVTSVAVTSAPCLTAWTLGEECEVTDLTFSTASIATCEQCYEFVSWTSCRLDCNGDCA
jgi:hypothetical protein